MRWPEKGLSILIRIFVPFRPRELINLRGSVNWLIENDYRLFDMPKNVLIARLIFNDVLFPIAISNATNEDDTYGDSQSVIADPSIYRPDIRY